MSEAVTATLHTLVPGLMTEGSYVYFEYAHRNVWDDRPRLIHMRRWVAETASIGLSGGKAWADDAVVIDLPPWLLAAARANLTDLRLFPERDSPFLDSVGAIAAIISPGSEPVGWEPVQ